MNEQAIDLGALSFWAAFFVALLVLTPIVKPEPRKAALAVINLGFVAFLIPRSSLPWLGLFLGASFLLLRWASHPKRKVGALLMLLVAGPFAFIIHKSISLLSNESLIHGVKPLLATIGFSYVLLRIIDAFRSVYEGRQPTPTFLDLVNYLLPFNMLAAGPIQPYEEFTRQSPVPDPLTTESALAGVERIAGGLFKKFVLAQGISAIFLSGFKAGASYLFVETQLFYLWVYLDFSAYSDIAVGVGRLVGVPTPENFDKPLVSRNIIEFWERWHISLSQFIRRNVFIPLQLNLMRRAEAASPLLIASIAFSLAFVLCGLWHGLTIRFLCWGAMHAAAVVGCNLYREALTRWLGKKGVKSYLALKPVRVMSTIVTFEFVAFSLMFMAHPSGSFFP